MITNRATPGNVRSHTASKGGGAHPTITQLPYDQPFYKCELIFSTGTEPTDVRYKFTEKRKTKACWYRWLCAAV